MREIKTCDVVQVKSTVYTRFAGQRGIALQAVGYEMWMVLFPCGESMPYGLTELVLVAPAIGV